jgi:hypothetical protein
MMKGQTEDSVKKEVMWDCSAFFCTSLYAIVTASGTDPRNDGHQTSD